MSFYSPNAHLRHYSILYIEVTHLLIENNK